MDRSISIYRYRFKHRFIDTDSTISIEQYQVIKIDIKILNYWYLIKNIDPKISIQKYRLSIPMKILIHGNRFEIIDITEYWYSIKKPDFPPWKSMWNVFTDKEKNSRWQKSGWRIGRVKKCPLPLIYISWALKWREDFKSLDCGFFRHLKVRRVNSYMAKSHESTNGFSVHWIIDQTLFLPFLTFFSYTVASS